MIKLSKIISEVLEEGVYDPGILKVVFLAGGPGSGKTTVANALFGITSDSFSVQGLKPVNSDKFFEFLLRKGGISTDLASLPPDEFLKVTVGPESERERGKALKEKSFGYYLAGRLGMLIDGTGDDASKVISLADDLKKLGYDASMVFVNTSMEKALERNNNRPRKLPSVIVTNSWKEAQKAKTEYQRYFGKRFIEVFNDKDSAPGQPINIDPIAQKSVDKLMRMPVENPIGKEWIKTALAQKSSVKEEAQSQYEIFCDMDGVLCDFVKQWNAYFGENPDQTRHTLGKQDFDVLLDATPVQFWSEMDWMPGADMMWNIIKKYGTKILSAPADSEASPKGKQLWVQKHVPGTEIIFRKSTMKQEFSGPNKILIDDLKRNVDQWIARGGIGILHTDPRKTIQQLKDLGIV